MLNTNAQGPLIAVEVFALLKVEISIPGPTRKANGSVPIVIGTVPLVRGLDRFQGFGQYDNQGFTESS